MAASACSSSGTTSVTTGGNSGGRSGPIPLDIPVGTLQCGGGVALGGSMGELSGDGTITLTETDGVLHATLGDIATGELDFSPTTSITATLVSGSFVGSTIEGDAGPPIPAVSGFLGLLAGSLILEVAGANGASATVLSCTVPYASCSGVEADHAAPFPTGQYVSCQTSNGASPSGTVGLTASGGAITATLSSELLDQYEASTPSSLVFTVVAPNTAVYPAPGSADASCNGSNLSAFLYVAGGVLQLAYGVGDGVGMVSCTQGGS